MFYGVRPSPSTHLPTWTTFLSGSSPLTCLARDAITVASLKPAQLSGSFDYASPTTTSK